MRKACLATVREIIWHYQRGDVYRLLLHQGLSHSFEQIDWAYNILGTKQSWLSPEMWPIHEEKCQSWSIQREYYVCAVWWVVLSWLCKVVSPESPAFMDTAFK